MMRKKSKKISKNKRVSKKPHLSRSKSLILRGTIRLRIRPRSEVNKTRTNKPKEWRRQWTSPTFCS